MSALELHGYEDRGCWVVRLQDEVDHATVPYWKGILDLLNAGCYVAVDLHAVRYIDSAGIALLVWLRRRTQETNGRLVLTRVPRFLERLLRIAGIPGLIPCYGDIATAVDSLAAA